MLFFVTDLASNTETRLNKFNQQSSTLCRIEGTTVILRSANLKKIETIKGYYDIQNNYV